MPEHPEFTSLEIQLIKSCLFTKTDQEIAELLEQPVERVTAFIEIITEGKSAKRSNTLQGQRDQQVRIKNIKAQKKVEREKEKSFESDQKLKRHARSKKVIAQDSARKAEREAREARFKKQTRMHDYSQMKTVKVDKGTWVWVAKEIKPEEVLHQYRKNQASKERVHLPTNNTKYNIK